MHKFTHAPRWNWLLASRETVAVDHHDYRGTTRNRVALDTTNVAGLTRGTVCMDRPRTWLRAENAA